MSNEDILKEVARTDLRAYPSYFVRVNPSEPVYPKEAVELAISLTRADVLKKVEEISKIKNDKDMRIALIEFLYKNSPKELNSQQSDVKEDVGGSNPSKSSITEAVPQVSADSSNKKRATQK